MDRTNLHDYQNRAVEFVKDNTHAGLFIEMGCGKSIITLTAISDMLDDVEISKVLVVAPLKVAQSTWTEEVKKWSHLSHLKVSRILGSEKQRIEALKEKADIYVIGRDSFVWLVRHCRSRMPFDMLVIDELTSFKSSSSLRFKALRLVRSQFNRIVGLTGTPAPNGYLDLWAQVFCLDGGERLGKYKSHYIRNYFRTVMSPQHYMVQCNLAPGAKEKIENKVSDICLSMKAEDYITLPPVSYIQTYVELPKEIMRRYKEFARERIMQVGESNITATNAAAMVGKLSQFCNGAIYNDENPSDGCRLVTEIHNEKLAALAELVEQAKSPVLVFYQFKHDANRIAAYLKGHKVVIYDDEETLNEWNTGKIDVLLAHPASTAYGLNMQMGGHICVWFGTGYNAELYSQANARLYRQGQKHHVLVYQLIIKDTVDERALSVVNGKIKAQNALLDAIKDFVK